MHQDLRFAYRQLRKTPFFTLLLVLTLSLGIGGTTAIFSLVECVLLRPLPFTDPDRLVLLGDHLGNRPGISVTAREIGTYASTTEAFSETGGYIDGSYEVSGGAISEQLNGRLGIRKFSSPLLPRDFARRKKIKRTLKFHHFFFSGASFAPKQYLQTHVLNLCNNALLFSQPISHRSTKAKKATSEITHHMEKWKRKTSMSQCFRDGDEFDMHWPYKAWLRSIRMRHFKYTSLLKKIQIFCRSESIATPQSILDNIALFSSVNDRSHRKIDREDFSPSQLSPASDLC